MVDAALLQKLLQVSADDAGFQAGIALNRVPGAGVWLTAPPVEDRREIDAPLFQICVKRRLRVPIFEEDGLCVCCGQVMDKWADHALVCPCGGDRTVRHNALRNVVHEEASNAGLRPEREKAGLLPPRPAAEGVDDSSTRNGRRPADVWLPRGPSGAGEALDFAVTSGLRSDTFRTVAGAPTAVFQRYEDSKRTHAGTSEACRAAGFCFTPMVMEAHSGGWSPTARAVLDWMVQQLSAV